jgi:hypothetical protein
MRLPSRTGKKLFTKIADVLQDWLTQAPVKLMFQDEARAKYFHHQVFDSLDALEHQPEVEANPDRMKTIPGLPIHYAIAHVPWPQMVIQSVPRTPRHQALLHRKTQRGWPQTRKRQELNYPGRKKSPSSRSSQAGG